MNEEMLGGLVCFGAAIWLGGVLLLLMAACTKANEMEMREQQERNEAVLRERLQRKLAATSDAEVAMLKEYLCKKERPKSKEVIAVKTRGQLRRFSVNKYGEVFEER